MKSVAALVLAFLAAGCKDKDVTITTGTLLREMTDLRRLATLAGPEYRAIQYSSYDRRSSSPGRPGWFANEDGFGGEPVPGFEDVIRPPDSSGTGVYLICDVRGPGAIQRLWTATISGMIRLYIDSADKPVYEGEAQEFFHNPLAALTNGKVQAGSTNGFRQFDAFYLPVPFSQRCRIEWTGNINDPHFYHVGLRIYEKGTKVESFSAENILKYSDALAGADSLLALKEFTETLLPRPLIEKITAAPGKRTVLKTLTGPGAIVRIKMKVESSDLENALRKSLFMITFDGSSLPQVSAPAGDFFCSAPGINPFASGPVSVMPDSTMIFRFRMPFREKAVIEFENLSDETSLLSFDVMSASEEWAEGKTMYFNARWNTEYDLITGDSDSAAKDISFLETFGQGRLVGSAVMLYNPSGVPTSWGNWWGEGDEKIFIDADTFPSFFGTGSEDYFNYSWSSPLIFSYTYCGQPRNDGPGNRGYVSNFRWHISDDIPYSEKLRFLMELRHHDFVDDFVFARTVYYYSLPVDTLPSKDFSSKEIRNIFYKDWSPKAFKGSLGWRFVQAEKLVSTGRNFTTVSDSICSGKLKLTWIPENPSEKLKLAINSEKEIKKTRIGLTIKHSSIAGSLKFLLNGQPLRFDNSDTLILQTGGSRFLENHFSAESGLQKGVNELELIMPDANGKRRADVDFVWLRNN